MNEASYQQGDLSCDVVLADCSGCGNHCPKLAHSRPANRLLWLVLPIVQSNATTAYSVHIQAECK
jgi:hypothetical protein